MRGRAPDPDRARLVQSNASDLQVAARNALDKALTFSGLLGYWRERARRRQCAAIGGANARKVD